MKRVFAILTAALALSLTACGQTDDSSADTNSQGSANFSNSTNLTSSNSSADPNNSQTSTTSTTSTSTGSVSENSTDNSVESAAENNSNILIAYFTAAENSGVDAVASASCSMVNGSAVGRLRAIADMIQAETGGDLFSIRTSVVYPADGAALIDYAADEQNEDARPELTSHIDDLDKYDVIFVGYPNWWADLPQVMYSFFDEYDFSGKTIIPFNVHNGSRLSGTVNTIKELEPNANVIEDAFTINERNAPEAASDVKEWLGGLEY